MSIGTRLPRSAYEWPWRTQPETCYYIRYFWRSGTSKLSTQFSQFTHLATMASAATSFSGQEQARIVAGAQDLFMERGIAPVTLAEVALTLRLPESTVARYFPDGKPALVAAATERYVTDIRQQLAQHRQQSSNAVEEMLRLRQTLLQLPDELRSLFIKELETDYPAQYRHVSAMRVVSILDYVRLNIQRGQAESLYQTCLDAESEGQQWLQQADSAMRAATTSHALFDQMAAQVLTFLARVTTPAGAHVARRLQEAEPYY